MAKEKQRDQERESELLPAWLLALWLVLVLVVTVSEWLADEREPEAAVKPPEASALLPEQAPLWVVVQRLYPADQHVADEPINGDDGSTPDVGDSERSEYSTMGKAAGPTD